MPHPILYLGDTALDDAAAYLAGVIHHAGWAFDYLPSDQPATAELFDDRKSLYILSDYPAEHLAEPLQRRLLEHVEDGSGLLMCGGWESFHGVGGDWDGTLVGDALPVEISGEDDRVNCDHPVLLRAINKHPILAGLPWGERPPVIGGFNRVRAKSAGTTLLEAVHFNACCDNGEFRFDENGAGPLLVVNSHVKGRIAAMMTDVAPHWVGPLVDWGDARVAAQAPNANDVEVGDLFAQFLRQLLGWVGRIGDQEDEPVTQRGETTG